jgi:hypothetical protein
MRCEYRKCKALAEYKTAFGNFCPFHFKALNKKKNLKGDKIKVDKVFKQMWEKFKNIKNIQINLGR